MASVQANGITIEYEGFGDEDAEAFLLISGLGAQMTRWTASFCQSLAARGYRVIRFDNRDTGLSTHVSDCPPPDIAAVFAAAAQGLPFETPYTLDDMVLDAFGVLDALAIRKAHFVGRSMGGMIAQLMASTNPDRAISLTSTMSSTGNPNLPSAGADVMAMLTQVVPHPFKQEEQYPAQSCRRGVAAGLIFRSWSVLGELPSDAAEVVGPSVVSLSHFNTYSC